MIKYIHYPKCTTCKKACSFLEKNYDINKFEIRDIKEENPTYDELKSWHEKYGFDLNKAFNTSGLIYREMNLKEKLNKMTDDEKLKLLSTNGMLVKRPILITDNNILFGFKEDKYIEMLK